MICTKLSNNLSGRHKNDMTRAKFATRSILLRSETQRTTLHALIDNLPLDDENPLEILVREKVEVRKLSQNSLMWVGPLADLEEQGYVKDINGQSRTYSAEVWHEQFKREYLIDEKQVSPEVLAELVKDPATYRKWDITPRGDRVLIGSTTELTKRGFALYLQQVILFGESIGVQFSTNRGAR